jgi:hypothetical protein
MEPLLFSLTSLREENGFTLFQPVPSTLYCTCGGSSQNGRDFNPASITAEAHDLNNETRVSALSSA